MQFKVNKDKCISCGTCIALAGASFKWDDDGKAEAVTPPGDDLDTVNMAKDSCPTQAIENE
jgi:ferredoxin